MSYEQKIEDRKDDRVDIGLLKFFWQINPLSRSAKDKIPKFLRSLEIFKNFSDLELWEMSRVFHHRSFEKGDMLFKEGELGVGFYIIVRGRVDIVIERDNSQFGDSNESNEKVVITLEKNSYLGELALLQDGHIRNASAIANESCQVLGIFKPDLDIIINEKPVIAAKLLQAVSLIVANRLYSTTQELRRMKQKITQLEEASANQK